ncbi:MAG: transketolase C-terminal domain-containing protein [bacterium]|nr:transketolase C-terminal domain-containing protein [bacterium]
MLNPQVKLSSEIFNKEIKQEPTRFGFGEGLIIAGEADPNVVVLCADITDSTRCSGFRDKFPERFFEMGIAEQNMAVVAAGLALSGKIPFISSYATFSPGRNWEQIRSFIAYGNTNVNIAGAHAGISTGPDGATHQATEDLAIMRVLPGMRIFVPCDSLEAKKATVAAAKIWGPDYIRLTREKTPVFTTDQTPFIPGKAEIFWDSSKPQCAIIGCGPLVYNALLAAKDLAEEGINTIVVNNHTLKPMDEKIIIDVAKKCRAVVTVEEHQVKGGLGGAVAEILAKNYPTPMEFIGMQDTFGESGNMNDLLEKYGMGVDAIKEAVKRVIKKR